MNRDTKDKIIAAISMSTIAVFILAIALVEWAIFGFTQGFIWSLKKTGFIIPLFYGGGAISYGVDSFMNDAPISRRVVVASIGFAFVIASLIWAVRVY